MNDAHVSHSDLIKIKLYYGENCLKSLLNDLFLFNRKYQIWFQLSLGLSISGSVRFWTKINNQTEIFFYNFLNRTKPKIVSNRLISVRFGSVRFFSLPNQFKPIISDWEDEPDVFLLISSFRTSELDSDILNSLVNFQEAIIYISHHQS